MDQEKEHPFYGTEILRNKEQAHINALLSKYKNEPATEELKAKIYDELQMEKHFGRIKIPFKVYLKNDPTGKFPNYVEVVLDTKV